MNNETQSCNVPLLLNPTPAQLQAMQAALKQSSMQAAVELQLSRHEIIQTITQALKAHNYDLIFEYYESYAEHITQDPTLFQLFEQARVESKSFGYISQIRFIYETLPKRYYDTRYAIFEELKKRLDLIDSQVTWFQIPTPDACDDHDIGEPFDGLLDIPTNIASCKAFYPGIIHHIHAHQNSTNSQIIPIQFHTSIDDYTRDPETTCRQYYHHQAQQGSHALIATIQQFITNAPLTDYAIHKYFAYHALEMPDLAQFYCLNRREILTKLQSDIRELRHDEAEMALQTYHDIAFNLNDASFRILEVLANVGFEIYASRSELELELNITPPENVSLLYYNTQRLYKLYPTHKMFLQGENGLISLIEKRIQESQKQQNTTELPLLYQKLYCLTQNQQYLEIAQNCKKPTTQPETSTISVDEDIFQQTSGIDADITDCEKFPARNPTHIELLATTGQIGTPNSPTILTASLQHSKSIKNILSLVVQYGILTPFMGTIFLTLLITTILAITQIDVLTPVQKALALASLLDIPIAGFILYLNIPVARTYLFQRLQLDRTPSVLHMVLINVIAYFILIGIRVLFTCI